MKNAIVPISKPTPSIDNIHERIRRGQAIAHLYVAAQHLSQVASDDACRLIEEANDPWQNHGFNQIMRKSPFPTRVGGGMREWFMQPESVVARDERLRRMSTPPWKEQSALPRADIMLNDEPFMLIPVR